jgi:hypothetical protein
MPSFCVRTLHLHFHAVLTRWSMRSVCQRKTSEYVPFPYPHIESRLHPFLTENKRLTKPADLSYSLCVSCPRISVLPITPIFLISSLV